MQDCYAEQAEGIALCNMNSLRYDFVTVIALTLGCWNVDITKTIPRPFQGGVVCSLNIQTCRRITTSHIRAAY